MQYIMTFLHKLSYILFIYEDTYLISVVHYSFDFSLSIGNCSLLFLMEIVYLCQLFLSNIFYSFISILSLLHKERFPFVLKVIHQYENVQRCIDLSKMIQEKDFSQVLSIKIIGIMIYSYSEIKFVKDIYLLRIYNVAIFVMCTHYTLGLD